MWVFRSLGLYRLSSCCFVCSCLVSAHTPGWVRHCSADAHVRKDRVLACGSAETLDGDVDYAAGIASADARSKLADFILKTQRPKPAKKVRVEIQGTKLDAKWIGQARVYVLLSMDIKESKKARIVIEQPSQTGATKESIDTRPVAPAVTKDGETKQKGQKQEGAQGKGGVVESKQQALRQEDKGHGEKEGR